MSELPSKIHQAELLLKSFLVGYRNITNDYSQISRDIAHIRSREQEVRTDQETVDGLLANINDEEVSVQIKQFIASLQQKVTGLEIDLERRGVENQQQLNAFFDEGIVKNTELLEKIERLGVLGEIDKFFELKREVDVLKFEKLSLEIERENLNWERDSGLGRAGTMFAKIYFEMVDFIRNDLKGIAKITEGQMNKVKEIVEEVQNIYKTISGEELREAEKKPTHQLFEDMFLIFRTMALQSEESEIT